jgi:hypothetical protein
MEVEALHGLLHAEYASAEELKERLRSILAPHLPAIPLEDGRALVPRMD